MQAKTLSAGSFFAFFSPAKVNLPVYKLYKVVKQIVPWTKARYIVSAKLAKLLWNQFKTKLTLKTERWNEIKIKANEKCKKNIITMPPSYCEIAHCPPRRSGPLVSPWARTLGPPPQPLVLLLWIHVNFWNVSNLDIVINGHSHLKFR